MTPFERAILRNFHAMGHTGPACSLICTTFGPWYWVSFN